MKYRNFIEIPYNNLSGREELEWSNVWIDSANAKNSKRILLIGDSTVRMIRSTFAKKVKCPVDMIGSSSRLDDILFINLIDSFFDDSLYKYDCIFLQLGHHGRTNRKGGKFNEDDLNQFENGLKALIFFLQQFSNNIIVESIFDSVITNNILNKLQKKLPFINNLLRFVSYKEVYDNNINIKEKQKKEVKERRVGGGGGGGGVNLCRY